MGVSDLNLFVKDNGKDLLLLDLVLFNISLIRLRSCLKKILFDVEILPLSVL